MCFIENQWRFVYFVNSNNKTNNKFIQFILGNLIVLNPIGRQKQKYNSYHLGDILYFF